MKNPISPLIDRYLGPSFSSRARMFVVGIVEDFWTDGPENPLFFGRLQSSADALNHNGLSASPHLTSSPSRNKATTSNRHLWHAEPGEILEAMFGEGIVVPADLFIMEMMVKLLGLTKEKSVLDLSAGLGSHLRKIVAESGANVTGLETDPDLAARAMTLSVISGKAQSIPIDHYDTDNLSLTRMYDCVLARDIFFKIRDKETFFKLVSVAMKPRGQLAFTDYILEPIDRDHPAIVSWLATEAGATPLSLNEMTTAWSKVDVKLSVNEDMTNVYKRDALRGLQKLAAFLTSGIRPDAETKTAIQTQLLLWTQRLGAMEKGLKFYRFYGTKG